MLLNGMSCSLDGAVSLAVGCVEIGERAKRADNKQIYIL